MISREQILFWTRRSAIVLAGVIVAGVAIVAFLLNNRPNIEDVDWPEYPEFERAGNSVTMTWLGVTTLLFDDGTTQILIDGFFSRPSMADLVFDTRIESKAAQIDRVLDEYQMRRLAAIIPIHNHFDHAMDIGAIANRSSASIIGSASSANVARGAGVPEDQIIVAENGARYDFGEFTVRLIETNHAPIGWGGSTPYDGTVDEPLKLPAKSSAWRVGKSYSVVVSHPQGTALVHGSAGILEGSLDDVAADVVLLGTFGLDGLGRDYTELYWQALVTSTGATRVIPIHFDDYTRPFGTIELAPRVLDDFVETAQWLEELRQTWDQDVRLHLPTFGVEVVLYPPPTPDA
ncbi:MAG: MBL fold metallo-hydrolase [Pseudomonadota bacterium]